MQQAVAATGHDAEYEDYTTTSNTYDSVRAPVGLDSLGNALKMSAANNNLSVDELRLLDVGCGTGNYIDAVKNSVKSCNGLEFNDGMFEQASRKHNDDDRVTLTQGSVLNMECFEDNSFDTVIMTQVLHHLTPDTHLSALKEISRVLKTGGTFWLSTQTPHQHMAGFWWAPIIPQAAATLAARFPGPAVFERQLAEAGLKQAVVEVPSEPLIRLEDYLDIDGPFKEVYRQGDSTWALAIEDELSAGQMWWRQKIDDGSAAQYLIEREAERERHGQTTAITSVKC